MNLDRLTKEAAELAADPKRLRQIKLETPAGLRATFLLAFHNRGFNTGGFRVPRMGKHANGALNRNEQRPRRVVA